MKADLGFACVDLAREERCGRPEAIYGEGKTPEQLAGIAEVLHAAGQPVLATRVSRTQYEAVQLPGAEFHELARVMTVGRRERRQGGEVGVVSAGTCDQPVAEEAAVTLNFLGWPVHRICDVGVAGIHRLLERMPEIRSWSVVIVVAGMEGALPGVIAGMVERPVIAVPTSVGYGVGAGGQVALMSMLSSCASGMTVVNIDNGYGAACAADNILRLKVS